MKLVLITSEQGFPREHAVIASMFAAGLERLHVRKPGWTREALTAWLAAVPEPNRHRLVLHSHHELADDFGCGGIHFRDAPPVVVEAPFAQPAGVRTGVASRLLTSRSCHSIDGLVEALGRDDAVFLSPVFPSISKPGHVPVVDLSDLSTRLLRRGAAERKTAVIALGGITAANATVCRSLGFDGVAVLGAVWLNSDPLNAYLQIKREVEAHAR